MPKRFRLRPIPLLATIVAVAIGVAAGQWQTRRGDQKQLIEDRMAARAAAAPAVLGAVPPPLEAVEYAPVQVRGSFLANWPLYLDNRPQDGHAGFYVLMPLQIEGSDKVIMIERGWAARNVDDRLAVPKVVTPDGVVELTGLVKKDAGHVMQLGSAPPVTPGAILQNLDLPAFAAASKLPTLPYVLEQHNDSGDGLTRDWPRASSGIATHRGYAFQWYGLAAAALIFFLVTGFRRGAKREPS